MEIQARVKIKPWGNSLGLIIPKEIVKRENLRAHEDIHISIMKKNSLEDFFGAGKRKADKINTQKMKNEARKTWKME